MCSLFLQSLANREELCQGNSEWDGAGCEGKYAKPTSFLKAIDVVFILKVSKVNFLKAADV